MPTKSTTRPPTPLRPSSGISRIDQPERRTHGYFVRLGYEKTAAGWRPSETAFFGDFSHGGKRAAWKAAEEWVAKMRRKTRKSAAKTKAKKPKQARRK